MAKQTFSTGQTLTAAQMTSLQQNDWNWSTTVQTGDYTLVAADAGTREVANAGTAITFTVPNSTFTAGDSVEIHNINSGLLTIAAGGGVTLTSADVLTVQQWQGGTLYFTSASAAIWFPRAKTITPSGLVLVKSQTIGTAVSNVEVTGAFSADYDNYLVIVSGGSASIDTRLNIQFGATTTGYKWVTEIVTWDSPQATNETGSAAASNIDYVAATSGTSLAGHMTILNPFLTENTFVIADGLFDGDNGGGWTRGILDNTTSYTAFTLSLTSGTMTGGTVKVYGYRN